MKLNILNLYEMILVKIYGGKRKYNMGIRSQQYTVRGIRL
uniref:Uncharacterized protein n=1 Tax=Bacillus cereus HuA4-10 TaxID=1053206 RepID=J8D9U9_BACCE|nr:hypothetical protein IGC_01865 [Bacillus cereus HuA4-10]